MTSDTSTALREDGAVRAALDGVSAARAADDADAFVAWYAAAATAVLQGTCLQEQGWIRASMAAAFAGPPEDARALREGQRARSGGGAAAVGPDKGAVLPAGQTDPAAGSRALATWVQAIRDGTGRVGALPTRPSHAA
jgi:uncharacterized protein (TIGR02246 family)